MTEQELRQLSRQEGAAVEAIAARLLARAVRTARPKRVFNTDQLRAQYADFADEDMAMADSDKQARLDLLTAEDRA
jgi:hypothetical protein